MSALIECVPNFSEGRDPEVIRRITARIESVDGATLLHVDPGKATNRTVVTFAGPPEAVVEAAFRAVAEAAESIDMRHHAGEHPRMGATDVCPLIPISGIGMEETAEHARRLAERVGRELGVDRVYAEQTPEQKLEIVRALQRQPELRAIVMVGDGINDAPALALADVGIAMGSAGATVSSETADAVVLVDRVDRIADAIRFGRRALHIARQSVLLGIGASLVAMAFAAAGFLPPVAGALLQEGIDVAVILNALRALAD
jgi:phosphoglycolate phosphatase-like HAD superfamily hydrolase